MSFIFIFLSCDGIGSADDTDKEILIEPENDSVWFTRQMYNTDTEGVLNFIRLTKTDDTHYELYSGQYTGNLSNDIIDEYLKYNLKNLFIIELEEGVNSFNLSIVGIKNTLENSFPYYREGDAEYTSLLEDLDIDSFSLEHYQGDSYSTLFTEAGEWARLEREWRYDVSGTMEIEDDGSTYTADTRERIWYVPMGDTFRFIYRWENSYTAEDNSTHSGYFHIETYGSRVFDVEQNAYVCEIESYSTNSFPLLLVYSSSPAYEMRMKNLGFSQFDEKTVNDEMILSMEIDEEQYELVLGETPLN